jgi:hypothetical protein
VEGDRGFESVSLQRRVYCEPEFSGGYPINARRTFQLQQRGIEKIIVVGVLANTCVEATARCRAKGRPIEEIDAALAKPRSFIPPPSSDGAVDDGMEIDSGTRSSRSALPLRRDHRHSDRGGQDATPGAELFQDLTAIST